MHVITCEQVSNGHPDKICDQIADAIVTDVLSHDRSARVAAEVLIKGNQIIIAGEITSSYTPHYRDLVKDVFAQIGLDRLGYEQDVFDIHILMDRQSPDIALGVDKGGAGDQGMMYGYATNETPELLPIESAMDGALLFSRRGLWQPEDENRRPPPLRCWRGIREKTAKRQRAEACKKGSVLSKMAGDGCKA